jgi:hypothetical protein
MRRSHFKIFERRLCHLSNASSTRADILIIFSGFVISARTEERIIRAADASGERPPEHRLDLGTDLLRLSSSVSGTCFISSANFI